MTEILTPEILQTAQTAVPIITNNDGKLVTTSRNVANVFEKEHKNVIRDIRNVLANNPDRKFNGLNFELVEYRDEKGESRPEYLLTKDGFTLLVMGYTGAKAFTFKVAYINRFNEMEKQLKHPVQQQTVQELMSNAKFLLDIAGITGNQQVLALDKIHKAKTGESLLALANVQLVAPQNEHLYTPTELGGLLTPKMKGADVNKKLKALGLQFDTRDSKNRIQWNPTPAGIKAGGVMLDVGKAHSTGEPIRHLHWTLSVLEYLK